MSPQGPLISKRYAPGRQGNLPKPCLDWGHYPAESHLIVCLYGEPPRGPCWGWQSDRCARQREALGLQGGSAERLLGPSREVPCGACKEGASVLG
jgi:hypothetical protein